MFFVTFRQSIYKRTVKAALFSFVGHTNIAKYTDILMPRETVSYNYVKDSGLIDMKKVKKYTDFTSLVSGTVLPNISI